MTPPAAADRPRIAHASSAHPRRDIRIFVKECRSLAARGYDVHLYIADGAGDEIRDGVTFHDVGKQAQGGRLLRMLLKPWHIWRSVRRNGEAVLHFHDPELTPVALLLHWQGVRIIYDAHEDVPRQIQTKAWLPAWLRPAVASVFESIENFAARRFFAVVAATPHIAERFQRIGARSVNVSNYPLANELWPADATSARARDHRTVCYIGGISRIRGVAELIGALPAANARLVLAGPFEDTALEAELRGLPGWQCVDYRGVVSREGVRDILAAAQVGVVLFQPLPNHVDALPNKMFEYMSAGVPVLASDFSLWQEIVVGADAGRCVDPTDPAKISSQLKAMLDDGPGLMRQSAAARLAVRDRYNWASEELKLACLYASVAGRRTVGQSVHESE